MCDARDVMGYDKRKPELSDAPLHMNMKQDTTSIEK